AMAFKGLGKAMTDQEAFSKLGPNAQNLVLALNRLKPVWSSVQNEVRETLLNGIGEQLLFLGDKYIPMLNRNLKMTANLMNTAMRNLAGWAGSKEGTIHVGRVMETSGIMAGGGMDAAQRFL